MRQQLGTRDKSPIEVLNSKIQVETNQQPSYIIYIYGKQQPLITCNNTTQMTMGTTLSTMMPVVQSPEGSLPQLQQCQHQRIRWQHQKNLLQQLSVALLLVVLLQLPCLCWSMPTYILEIPSQKCIEVEGPVDSTIRIAYFMPGVCVCVCDDDVCVLSFDAGVFAAFILLSKVSLSISLSLYSHKHDITLYKNRFKSRRKG
jgi:hypothetical protein